MSEIDIALYDAFTERRFCGNTAGVVPEADTLTGRQMQCVATELNAATTGFVCGRDDAALELRFFTPTTEIAMCGHVVVGTLSCLVERGRIEVAADKPTQVELHTRAGVIVAELTRRANGGVFVFMRQNRPTYREATVERGDIAGILGVSPTAVSEHLPLEIVSTALRHLFVPLTGLDAIRELAPDFERLAALSRRLGVETINVFTLETVDAAARVHSRDFSPAIGVDEEAGSGTTNAALSCYLIKHGVIRSDARPSDGAGMSDNLGGSRVSILAEQGFEMGRPSRIRSQIRLADGEIDEVWVGGTAVRVLTGSMCVNEPEPEDEPVAAVGGKGLRD